MKFLFLLFRKINEWVWADLPSYPDIYINLRKSGYCEFDALELAYVQYNEQIQARGYYRQITKKGGKRGGTI